MRNPECRGCGITPADVPDGAADDFREAFDDGLCPACQLPSGSWITTYEEDL